MSSSKASTTDSIFSSQVLMTFSSSPTSRPSALRGADGTLGATWMLAEEKSSRSAVRCLRQSGVTSSLASSCAILGRRGCLLFAIFFLFLRLSRLTPKIEREMLSRKCQVRTSQFPVSSSKSAALGLSDLACVHQRLNPIQCWGPVARRRGEARCACVCLCVRCQTGRSWGKKTRHFAQQQIDRVGLPGSLPPAILLSSSPREVAMLGARSREDQFLGVSWDHFGRTPLNRLKTSA
jgi:hypothetical protein